MEILFIYLFKKRVYIEFIQKHSSTHFSFRDASEGGVERSVPSKVSRVEVPTVGTSEGRLIVGGSTLLDGALREVPASTAEPPLSTGRPRPRLLKKASISRGYLGAALHVPYSYPSLYFLNLKIFISYQH